MHSANYVFGSEGVINQTNGWNTGLAFLFGLLSVQWTVREDFLFQFTRTDELIPQMTVCSECKVSKSCISKGSTGLRCNRAYFVREGDVFAWIAETYLSIARK